MPVVIFFVTSKLYRCQFLPVLPGLNNRQGVFFLRFLTQSVLCYAAFMLNSTSNLEHLLFSTRTATVIAKTLKHCHI